MARKTGIINPYTADVDGVDKELMLNRYLTSLNTWPQILSLTSSRRAPTDISCMAARQRHCSTPSGASLIFSTLSSSMIVTALGDFIDVRYSKS
jgi:hypothetical protein